MAENSYYCGLMFGTNRNKSDDEIFALQEKALTVDETKALLNDMDVSKDSIFIYVVAQPYSSYLYEIDDDYCNKVSELFDRKFVVMNSESYNHEPFQPIDEGDNCVLPLLFEFSWTTSICLKSLA